MYDLLRLKEEFSRQGVLISFNGSLTNSIIEEIGNAIKRYLEDGQHGKGTITDVFAAYIEQTQNVRNYMLNHDLHDTHSSSIVVISSLDGNYQIGSGNSIRKEDVSNLISHLERINSLDKDGLKKLYKEQIRKERNPDSRGAGLGLIDIARRSTGKLEYTCEHLDENHDFFSLYVTIKGYPHD
ncbi:MAG TPA: SiaB family protein kinase [Methanospirillum sp.]|nr:SiaB family protein kinase [Methanospirillum sp.]